MIKKENKIIVVVSPHLADRKKMIMSLAVKFGFALIPSDASKIIKNDIYSFALATSYFVMCSTYNFRGSILHNQKLYEMAAKGIFVCVGVKSIPREFEMISQVFYPEELL